VQIGRQYWLRPAVAVERALFAMVANRLSPTPGSKRAGCAWGERRVFIEELGSLSEDACYRAMDFLRQALAELAEAVFFSVANLLNLAVDILFFDTTSTYFERDSADEALADDEDEEEAAEPPDPAGEAQVPGDADPRPSAATATPRTTGGTCPRW
jgi:hypothetical protein